LSFARETKPNYREFDMGRLIEETLALLNHRFEMQNIRLETDIQDELVMYGDDKMLQQVLVNILLNAIQASKEESTIEVNARLVNKNEQVCIEIRDQGSGIAEEYLNQIFDPFFTTKAEGKGTGLGLSVSYGIVKHHGGRIQLENNEAGGACVSIFLPVKSAVSSSEVHIMEAANVI
jgi:two-component system NtrC family sensor kinase